MTRPYTSTRHAAVVEKIPKERTGLRSSIFVHVELDEQGDLSEVRFSEKGKEASTLEHVLVALGDSVTGIIRDWKKARE